MGGVEGDELDQRTHATAEVRGGVDVDGAMAAALGFEVAIIDRRREDGQGEKASRKQRNHDVKLHLSGCTARRMKEQGKDPQSCTAPRSISSLLIGYGLFNISQLIMDWRSMYESGVVYICTPRHSITKLTSYMLQSAPVERNGLGGSCDC